MDPQLVDALRYFLLPILAGGAIAVIAQRLAFGHARRLQREEHDRRDAALRRALLSEIDENIQALSNYVTFQLQRSAWDAARVLTFGAPTFDVLSAAYLAAARLNANTVAVAERRARSTSNVVPWGAETPTDPKPVLEAFQKARDELAKL